MPRILVVEDDIIIQKIMRHRLEGEGYEVLVAGNGVDGVRLAQTEKPDVILMDLWLPMLNGWEATRQIKATEDVSIIAITGAATTEDRQKMFAAGCAGYITKPVDFAELSAQIKALLA